MIARNPKDWVIVTIQIAEINARRIWRVVLMDWYAILHPHEFQWPSPRGRGLNFRGLNFSVIEIRITVKLITYKTNISILHFLLFWFCIDHVYWTWSNVSWTAANTMILSSLNFSGRACQWIDLIGRPYGFEFQKNSFVFT